MGYFRVRGKIFRWGLRTYIMGILNVTPDSFSDGGSFYHPEAALRQAERLIEDGADILDIGGESTRPFAEPVSEEEELRRVIPVIEAVRQRFPEIPISVDTYKARVAEEALSAGADIVNDVSALRFDPGMTEVIRRHRPPVVLMHMKGTPQTMQIDPRYEDPVREIREFLRERAELVRSLGVPPQGIIVDPGIGFGKRFEDNLALLRAVRAFRELGYPVLYGPSRKAFLGEILKKEARERDIGTVATVVFLALSGADLVRVHNVAWCREALAVIDHLRERI
ncbi:dihydropteroate synthase [Thermosulfurimonas sp. F29]|uniref:dihydropteroate synthase n=1 Tax=Thermosulfurimonas sp. F29 TaxID=2867247 RepID=UPI001C828F7E|nr:dihydropteroate synthase [Thermosulfurimonas sp. F29]MBX6422884.1 dihydropteroate synthase [Thermosulfurimonas sp. F29]